MGDPDWISQCVFTDLAPLPLTVCCSDTLDERLGKCLCPNSCYWLGQSKLGHPRVGLVVGKTPL